MLGGIDYRSIAAAVKRALGTVGATLASLTVTGSASVGGDLTVTGTVSGGAVHRSYLAGLTLSAAGGSATMNIAAGRAADSTNTTLMTLAAAIAKTTAAWAVGNAVGGNLEAAAIANNTWYHFYEIMRPDTGVVDVGFSTSATAPTMPANYTLKRRIGSGKTDGAAQWVAFTQDGDLFEWTAIVADISANNPGVAAVTRTLNGVPTGVNVEAFGQLIVQNVAAGSGCYTILTDLATNDQAPGSTATDIPVAQNAGGGSVVSAGRFRVRTNTSGQIRSRVSFGDANVTLTLNTFGWIDTRGRNA
jgi:hypothetical protein